MKMNWKLFILPLLATRIRGDNATISTGYRNAAYFVNWAIYGRNFTPQDLPASNFTHLLYAFANIKPETGEVILTDAWADTDIHFPGDSWDDIGNNLYGCLKQLYLLKKENRNLKTLLSVGGWTYSSSFAIAASTPTGRSTFATSAVSLITNLGFDGLDIDWEYPANDSEAENFVLLLQTVREALDVLGVSLDPNYHFKLTVACPAGPSYYQQMHLREMDQYIDFWNLMAYGYAGSWSNSTSNQANLFHSSSNPASTSFDTETAISYYLSQGIAASKIVLGIPIYGRSFGATNGLGESFHGVGNGTWESGIYDFKDLPLSGAVEVYNSTTGSSYSYDSTKRELVSYDNIMVAKQKASWIQKMGLGGGMWWESSADRVGNGSLIQNVVAVLGGVDGSGLEISTNRLIYLNSTYDNIRAGMPGSMAILSISGTSLSLASSLSATIPAESSSTLLSTSAAESLVTETVIATSTETACPSEAISAGITFSSISTSPFTTEVSSVDIESSLLSKYSFVSGTSSACSDIPKPSFNSEIDSATTTIQITQPLQSSATNTAGLVSTEDKTTISTTGPSHSSSILSLSSMASSLTISSPTISSLCSLMNGTNATLYASEVTIYTTTWVPHSTVTTIVIVSKRAPNSFLSCSINSPSAPTSSAELLDSTSSLLTSSIESSSSASIYSASSPSFSASPVSSTTASSTSSRSASPQIICKTGGTCGSYIAAACPGGTCFCGLDAKGDPTCFQHQSCGTQCIANDDCNTGEACLVKSCCSPTVNCRPSNGRACSGGSTCLPLALWCPEMTSARLLFRHIDNYSAMGNGTDPVIS